MGLHDSLALPRHILRIPWGANGGRNGNLALILLAAAPVALPAAYLAYVLRQGRRRTTASTSIAPPDPLASSVATVVPAEVALAAAATTDEYEYVVARERIVSEAVPLETIRPALLLRGGPRLLDTYLATTMRAFAWTPQALVMRSLVARLSGGAAHADTFSASYLDACPFRPGDQVCGVYVVRERVGGDGSGSGSGIRGERVLLDLSPPEGWTGPVVTGVLDCGFEVEGAEPGEKSVRFVNETVLWRRREGEPPTLLERTFPRWLHTLMVGWMMVRGVDAVTGKDEQAKVKAT